MANSSAQTTFITLSYSNDSNEIIVLLKRDLLQCIDDGFQHYQCLMDALLRTKHPFKESQLREYHANLLKVITNEFKNSYNDFEGIRDGILTSQILPLLNLAKTKLEALINKSFEEIYLRKHEIQNEETGRKVKEFTNQAEALYNERAEADGFKVQGKGREEIKSFHKKWADDATQQFCKLLVENESEGAFWKFELNQRLDEYLSELLEDSPADAGECSDQRFIELQPKEEVQNDGTKSKPTKPLYPQLDLEDTGEFRRQESQKPEIVIQAPENKDLSNVDIGIYFDQNSFNVGMYQPSTSTKQNVFEPLVLLSPHILFAHEQILTGQSTYDYAGCKNYYFNVFNLVTETSASLREPVNLYFKGVKYALCQHQIIALFFDQVLKSVERERNVKIKKVIFTIPFTPTSAAKEIIRESARLAGLFDIRILTTLLTTMISTVAHSHYYSSFYRQNCIMPSKYVFVLDVQRQSFTMGLIELSATSIRTIDLYGSDNMTECQKKEFQQEHERLYDEQSVTASGTDPIHFIYQQAIHHVLKNRYWSLECIITNQIKNSVMQNIVTDILKQRLNILKPDPIVGCPLMGASLLSSITSNTKLPRELRFILPPCIQVYDLSSSCLEIYDNLKGKISNQSIYPNINPVQYYHHWHRSTSFQVNVFEHFGPEQCSYKVCKYEVSCLCSPTYYIGFEQMSDTSFPLEIFCAKDDDGIYALFPGNVPHFVSEFSMHKKPSCTNDHCKQSVEHIKLLKAYKGESGSM